MRISDWSSDVCSSDLAQCGGRQPVAERRLGGLCDVALQPRNGIQQPRLIGREAGAGRAAHIDRPGGGQRRVAQHRVQAESGIVAAAAVAPQRAGGVELLIEVSAEIGRASCRERVCQYVEISVVAVSLKKNKQQIKNDITTPNI